MRVKRSYLFAGGMAAAVALYFVVGSMFGDHGKKAEASPTRKDEPLLVRVADVDETNRPLTVAVRGRTEAARSVVVRAETSGVVAATPTPEGSWVRRGQVLCRLAVDARQASLDQARARLRSEQLQYEAAQRLQAQGFRSEVQVLAAKAEVDQAAAAVRQAEVVLEQINVRAPFDGVFDNREAEIGTFLSPGQPCGTVVELNPLLIVGDVTEIEAARLNSGAQATAKLTTGTELAGTVRFVARQADPATRTYRVEVTAPNPRGEIRSGLAAQILIATGQGPAHLTPVSALVLDSQGRQGVRHVVDGNKVAFAPVRVLEETPEGVWVSGLSGTVRVITVGQSYVSEGQTVRVSTR